MQTTDENDPEKEVALERCKRILNVITKLGSYNFKNVLLKNVELFYRKI